MKYTGTPTEYIMKEDGTGICPECGHIMSDFGSGHYHDCRYFLFEEDQDDDSITEKESVSINQDSLLQTAAQ